MCGLLRWRPRHTDKRVLQMPSVGEKADMRSVCIIILLAAYLCLSVSLCNHLVVFAGTLRITSTQHALISSATCTEGGPLDGHRRRQSLDVWRSIPFMELVDLFDQEWRRCFRNLSIKSANQMWHNNLTNSKQMNMKNPPNVHKPTNQTDLCHDDR